MRITDVRMVVHRRPAPTEFAPPTLTVGALSIDTDEGVSGQTLVGGPGAEATIAQIVAARPLLIGRDPLEIGAIWGDLWAKRRNLGIWPAAIGWIDIALWDLSGRAAGRPVHQLLGTCRREIPAYLSSWVHARPEAYAEEAEHYLGEGWPAYKIHPPTMQRVFSDVEVSAAEDARTCALVRAATGDRMELMLDSFFAYDYATAVRIGRAIQDLDFTWYEDPLPWDDLPGYLRLKQQLYIPLLATEVIEDGAASMREWVTSAATDGLRGDPIIKGGITPLMKIAHLAEAFGLPCEVHDGYTSTGNAASLNVAVAIPNCNWFEVLAIQSTGDYEIKHLHWGLTEPLDVKNGVARAPDKPGLGYDIDWELINASSEAEL